MRVLISILIGLLVVGCGMEYIPQDPKEIKSKVDDNNSTAAKSVKELTIKDVAGTYELKVEGGTAQMVFLENGKIEFYENGKKNQEESSLKMVGNEIHFDSKSGDVRVFRIKPNGDLTYIAEIEHGERHDHTKERQATFKRIKSENETPSKGDNKNSTTVKPVKELTLEEKVVGEYESLYNGKTYKRVFQENGIVEWYVNGRKRAEYKLEIVNGEIRAAFGSEYKDIYRINADRSITHIAYISDGGREDFPKEGQVTYRKIK